jgi:hypothetical protein
MFPRGSLVPEELVADERHGSGSRNAACMANEMVTYCCSCARLMSGRKEVQCLRGSGWVAIAPRGLCGDEEDEIVLVLKKTTKNCLASLMRAWFIAF